MYKALNGNDNGVTHFSDDSFLGINDWMIDLIVKGAYRRGV